MTEKECYAKAEELNSQNTDFFGENQLSTLSASSGDFHILTFDDEAERDGFIENWQQTVTASQRDRGYRGKIEKLRV